MSLKVNANNYMPTSEHSTRIIRSLPNTLSSHTKNITAI